MSGTTSSVDTSAFQPAIDSMQKAFEQAIEVNAQITVLKTKLGAEETAAQQRPNIG